MYSIEDRSQVITIGGVEHKLILTTKATKDITKRYGGLEKLGDKLLKNATMEESLGEVIWLIALLANQEILIHNLQHRDEPKPLLTEDEIELLTNPYELAEYKDAIDRLGQEMEEAEEQTEDFAESLSDSGDMAEDSSGKFEKVGSVVAGVGTAKIIEMGVKLVVQLAVGLVKAIPQLVASLPQIVTAIISGIGKAATSIVSVGKNIVTGLWSGVSSMISWVKNKISGFVGDIVGGIKSLLGTHSPSRVFAGIGDNMAKGLGEGFTDEMDKVSKDINNAIPTDFDVDARVGANTQTSGSGSGGTVITYTGPLVSVAQMVVRSEDDIRKVSQGLYNLMQSGTRAQGIIPIT